MLMASYCAGGQSYKNTVRAGGAVYAHTQVLDIVHDKSCFSVVAGYKHRADISHHLGFYSSVDLLVNQKDKHYCEPEKEWHVGDNTNYYSPRCITIPIVAGIDYKFLLSHQTNISIGAGVGCNVRFASDRFYYSWSGSEQYHGYFEYLGRWEPTVNLTTELSLAVAFGPIELALCYTNLGLHREVLHEYCARKSQIYSSTLDYEITNTNVYGAERYYVASLTVGYSF